ncbi:7433_t:CDS:2 [Ambispora leptoticha]|uniref:7433_t:CDS:1 n=1 Tax=Ambispora leptoticha TaxID=144679 RepID=A0A9N8V5Z0_9GLOM|nr:7433_t:CDS:2 [Ambispora leptoticha]
MSSSSSSVKTTTRYTTYTQRYIRVSEKHILPLIIYLRPENTNWFNDGMFQELIVKLSKFLPPKIDSMRKRKSNESEDKQEEQQISADIFREKFHCAYYFRPTDVRHSVLIKDKGYVFPSSSSNTTGGEKLKSKEIEEEIKPELQVNYNGFSVFIKTLVVVVEPIGDAFEFIDNVKAKYVDSLESYFFS